MTPLTITFDWNVAQFLSLPVLIALGGGLFWVKKQIVNQLAKVGKEREAQMAAAVKDGQEIAATIIQKINENTAATTELSVHMAALNGTVAEHIKEDSNRFASQGTQLAHIEGVLTRDERATTAAAAEKLAELTAEAAKALAEAAALLASAKLLAEKQKETP